MPIRAFLLTFSLPGSNQFLQIHPIHLVRNDPSCPKRPILSESSYLIPFKLPFKPSLTPPTDWYPIDSNQPALNREKHDESAEETEKSTTNRPKSQPKLISTTIFFPHSFTHNLGIQHFQIQHFQHFQPFQPTTHHVSFPFCKRP